MMHHISTVWSASLVGAIGLAATLTACSSPSNEGEPEPPSSVKKELERISGLQIFFGHQSVGSNILSGLRELASREGVPLRISQTPSALGLEEGTFGHHPIAHNGAPEVKIRSFQQAFSSDGGLEDPPSLAMMKFCYVDFYPSSNVEELFSQYKEAVEKIQADHPGTTMVHVTVPLTAKQSLFKSLAKRALGRASSEEMNAKREEFNRLMRETYLGKEPLFDLALLESTAEDGSRILTSWSSREVPMLAQNYTDDGEHLNAVGGERVARALVRLLASVAPEKEAKEAEKPEEAEEAEAEDPTLESDAQASQ